MSKDELIDALAASHRTRRWQMDVEPWDELDDEAKEVWRQEMRELWPLIVGFVADWLLANIEGGAWPAREAAGQWREDMA